MRLGQDDEHTTVRLRLPLNAALLGLVLFLLGGRPCSAQPATPEASGTLVRRNVLALYDSTTITDESTTLDIGVRAFLQMPLEYLGCVVHVHDVRAGVPPASACEDLRAVVLWAESDTPLPAWVLPQITTWTAPEDTYLVLFNSAPHAPNRDAWLAARGLHWAEGYAEGVLAVHVALDAGDAAAWEADPRAVATHEGVVADDTTSRAWVRTWLRSDPADVRTPVGVAPWGGWAFAPYTLLIGDGSGNRRWFIDPFQFFREALRLDALPAPDPVAFWGRRALLFHLDGDGFESPSTVLPGQPAAKVMLQEVLDHYRIPCTVSVIVGSLTPDVRNPPSNDAMRLARTILNRSYIEAASHTVSHPLRWKNMHESVNRAYPKLRSHTATPENEVRTSVRFINEHLLEGDKRCEVLLWSGRALPGTEALAACADLGVENLNGGTYRWDEAHNSVGYVTPLSLQRGEYLQVHAAAPNENEFAGFFDKHPQVFRHVQETIRRTGQGRMLRPANIYAHFYSAERPGRLQALRKLLDHWVIEQETAPITASQFTRAVRGARSARIMRVDTASGDPAWRITGLGACRTVRFERESRVVDFARSENVFGFRHVQGNLLVTMGAEVGRIALTAQPPLVPYLVEANHPVRARISSGRLHLHSSGHVPRHLLFGGCERHGAVRVRIDGRRRLMRADGKGQLALRLPRGTTELVVAPVRTQAPQGQ